MRLTTCCSSKELRPAASAFCRIRRIAFTCEQPSPRQESDTGLFSHGARQQRSCILLAAACLSRAVALAFASTSSCLSRSILRRVSSPAIDSSLTRCCCSASASSSCACSSIISSCAAAAALLSSARAACTTPHRIGLRPFLLQGILRTHLCEVAQHKHLAGCRTCISIITRLTQRVRLFVCSLSCRHEARDRLSILLPRLCLCLELSAKPVELGPKRFFGMTAPIERCLDATHEQRIMQDRRLHRSTFANARQLLRPTPNPPTASLVDSIA